MIVKSTQEDGNTEFKREYTQDIKKEVIAFANTAGGDADTGY
ncbi:MAG: ATP-binding protein [Treponema sp.]|nr:ATP-binding protein [Treponema sp.]